MIEEPVAAQGVEDNKKKKEKKSFKEQARDYRVALIALGCALTFSAASYLCGYFENRSDFTFQKVYFTVWAIVALFFGLNVGYTHPKAKRFWVFSDTVWIATAVLSLGSLLNPVEEIILTGTVEVSRTAAEGQHRLITNEIVLGEKSFCSTQIPTLQCRDWIAFRTQVDAQNVSPDTLLGRLQLGLKALPPHAAHLKHRKVIEEDFKHLAKAIDDGRTAQAQLENVSLLWPYINLSLLVIALGLRAGKTGAEWANNPADSSEIPWYRRLWNKLMRKSDLVPEE